jgi:phosphate transport system substrate-binding protein
MNEEQLGKARESGGEVVHIPLVMGAVVPAYNLPEIKAPLNFSGSVLADIFLGKITKWDDAALKALNPGVALPNEDIAVVHRSDGSGTTYVWVDYLSKVNADWKSKVGVGTSVNWPAGEGQKGNEGVAGQVRRTHGSIGYIELIYATQNAIQFGAVQNQSGAMVVPSLESITAAANGSLSNLPDDLRYSITNAAGKDSYPISGTTWAVVYVNQPADKGKKIVDFLHWVLKDGQQYAEGLHYAKLPKGLVARAEQKVDAIKVSK